MWWSLFTATTGGYEHVAIRTPEGRFIAALLMLVGIGTVGMLTGSITTYFMRSDRSRDPHVEHIQKQLDRWAEMSPAERRQLVRMLEAIGDDKPIEEAPRRE